jgi:phage/plasmid-like protein (TIGR03299 family)
MHGITPLDRGAVGFAKALGLTWHGFPQYVHLDGPVTLDEAMKVVDYEVKKVPMALHIPPEMQATFPNHMGFVPQSVPDSEGLTGPLMFALVRADTGNVVFDQTVSGGYTIYQNKEFLQKVDESLLHDNPQVVIESVGTLFAGRLCFTNIVLDQFQIPKDDSPQITRVMFYNAFGGRSITACMHHIRIVCNNTLMLAEAQGALNETLKKFRHTSGAPEKVSKHVLSLAKLQEVTNGRKSLLSRLTDLPMTGKDVENFLGNLIEIPEGAGKSTVTGRTNRRNEIERIFNDAPDLQGAIRHTRYAMLQAVTCYNQHHTIPDNSTEVDSAFAWWDVSTGGVRNDLNQKAFAILSKDGDIPEPPKKKISDPA